MTSPAFDPARTLPDPLPRSPFPLLKAWFDEAHALAAQPNPNAMVVATVDAGRPSSRVVLCRGLDADGGSLVFFTNRTSRKGHELTREPAPHAAALFHWDHLDLQVRVEGPTIPTTDAESDDYWARRREASKLAAWASDQSAPIASRDELVERLRAVCERFGADPDTLEHPGAIPRPLHWGGYRLVADRVELWAGSTARFHDRARWSRELTASRDGFTPGAWSATRLQP